jgi:Trp operon repressor
MELQEIFRSYIKVLKNKFDNETVSECINKLLCDNENGKCSATEEQVDMIAKLVDEDRMKREEIPQMFGKSYKQCVEGNIFNKIKTLPKVGIYSKVSALLLKDKLDKEQ